MSWKVSKEAIPEKCTRNEPGRKWENLIQAEGIGWRMPELPKKEELKGHCDEVLLKRGKVALNRAVSPGKKKPYVPGYVSHGKEAGLCSEYSGKPGKSAQALCPMLQVRKFPKVGNISVNCSAHFSAFPFSPKILSHKVLDALVPFQFFKYLDIWFGLAFTQFW